MEKEIPTLDMLERGSIIKVHFRKGFGRPKFQRFKFLGLQGNPEFMDKKQGYCVDGFILVVLAIDLTGTEIFDELGKQIPQALFPHTIKTLEELKPNSSHD